VPCWDKECKTSITPSPEPQWSLTLTVKNGAHKTGGRKSTKFVNKQLSDLCMIPTPDGHSSLSQNPFDTAHRG